MVDPSLHPGGLVVVVLILLLTVYSLRRLWVVWAEILNFDGVSGDTCDTWLVITFEGNSIFTESD